MGKSIVTASYISSRIDDGNEVRLIMVDDNNIALVGMTVEITREVEKIRLISPAGITYLFGDMAIAWAWLRKLSHGYKWFIR